MSGFAGLEVANVGINKPFSNTRDWDVLLYASGSNQALLIGCGIDSTKPATLTVSNSNAVFARDVYVSGVVDAVSLRQGGSNISSLFAASTHTHSATEITRDVLSTARLPSASTTSAGIVQLNDTLTSMSSNMAATANAVKQAYDRGSTGVTDASNKVSKTGDTMTGDLIVGRKDIQFPTGLTVNESDFGVSNRAAILVGNWGLLQDIFADGTRNFSIYQGIVGGATALNAFNILTNGNVGIGTTTPSSRLQVSGTLNATTLQQDGTGVALNGHTHDASAITGGTISRDRLPLGSTGNTGIVQLYGGVDSSSTSMAATASAVRAAFDTANYASGRADNAHSKLYSGFEMYGDPGQFTNSVRNGGYTYTKSK